ncbi:MAG: hypothetical protein M1829_000615 [Trizodia sp. TS-e1964]|nr:MAG: hypothetical protein M1829_000615 [Trizodia sp. TS-e1964]
MAAPHSTQQPAQGGAIDQKDVDDWMARISEMLSKPEQFTAPKAPGGQPWHTSFWECFLPVDLCLITCFCPCVTFGKTHHRTRKGASLEGFSPVNASCLGFWASGCFGLHFIPSLMQRGDIRAKNNIGGNMIEDCLLSYCCGCCTLIQSEKEAIYRQNQTGGVISQQYQQPAEEMQYPAKA